MRHNNNKIEIMEDIDKLLGLMISVRTVETSTFNTKNWVNHWIDLLSEFKTKMINDEDECSECHGDGAQYPSYAESIHDAEPCSYCEGYGFNSRKDIINLFHNIMLNAEDKNNSSISNFIDSVIEKSVYRI